MALPTVDAQNQTVLLGTTVPLSTLFTASDADGDALTRFQIRDNNNNPNSGYFTFNGVVQPPNTLLTYNYSDLNLLVYHSGTAITKEQIDIRVEAGGEWSNFASFLLFTVKENLNRPVVNAADTTVVQNEFIQVSDTVSFNDPDGYPVKRWRVRDRNTGAFSGNLQVNGVLLAAGQWHYVEAEDFGDLRFNAAFSAPNLDVIDIRGFDGADWSFRTTFNSFTTVNFNRPVVIPSEYQIATDERVALSELFRVNDADGNTIKRLRFWDAGPHPWSGNLLRDGIALPANQFHEFAIEELGRFEWMSASRSFNEQIRVQAFDGKHWSDLQTIRVATNEKPDIGVATDYSIRQQLEFVDMSNLIVKLDDGPVYSRYEVYDASFNSDPLMDLTGEFRNGFQVLPGGQVHALTPQDFFSLTFKTGKYEARSVDELYVRAFNGTFWSDWTRHTVRTEPEYIDALAAGSWLNFLPQQQGALNLTYSFMQEFPSYDSGEAPPVEFHRAWIEMRNLVRQAFVRVSEFANIFFEEVPDSVNTPTGLGGIIRIGTYCLDSPTVAYAFFPADPFSAPQGGDMWFNRFHMGGPIDPPPPQMPCPSSGVPFDAWDLGDTNYVTFVHEFGHALGLKHPFESDGGDPPPHLPPATDNDSFTVMSYTGTPAGNPRGHQFYDIAALQAIYGANNSFNSSNTVYNRAYFRNSWDIVDTIWDTGGYDKIDASDQLIPVRIDLRPGSFQRIGGNLDNLSITFGTTLEEAIGGSAADRLTGNDSVNRLFGNDGDDRLEGYGDNDFLFGGGGNDNYVYKLNDGDDIIDELSGAGRDTITVGLFLGLDSFTDDLSFTRSGNDLLIDFTIDDGISRGSVRVENHAFGKNRVETLDVLGQQVDLKFLYQNITSPGQQFALTATQGQYGLLVAPA